MTENDARSRANAAVERIVSRAAQKDGETAASQRAVVEEAITVAGLSVIEWERMGEDRAAVYDTGIAPDRCHKITVQFSSRAETGRNALTVRGVHGSIQSGARFVSTTVDQDALLAAVPAVHTGRDRIGIHLAVEVNPFDQERAGLPEQQLVEAIEAIARASVMPSQ